MLYEVGGARTRSGDPIRLPFRSGASYFLGDMEPITMVRARGLVPWMLLATDEVR